MTKKITQERQSLRGETGYSSVEEVNDICSINFVIFNEHGVENLVTSADGIVSRTLKIAKSILSPLNLVVRTDQAQGLYLVAFIIAKF